jgi:DNA-directed RNA polymerase specialized sigma24 family protein
MGGRSLEELIEAIRGGDPAAADEMDRRYRRPLMAFVVPRVYGDEAVAEDIVQDVFCALWQPAAAAPGPRSDSWLFGVAKHKIVDHFRKRSREQEGQEQLIEEQRDRSADDPGPAAEADGQGPCEEEQIRQQAAILRDRFFAEKLRWTHKYTEVETAIRQALLERKGRDRVRKHPAVRALGMRKRQLEKAIPKTYALLRAERELYEVERIYIHWRIYPTISNEELRTKSGLERLSEWDFRRRKARFNELREECERLVRRFFAGEGSGPDAGAFAPI